MDRMQIAKWVCLGCLLLSLTGCVRITENSVERGLGANTELRADPTDLHDVRVAAIEFDSKKASLDEGRLGLMVVVENRGDAPERNVPVRVILSDDADLAVLDRTEYASTIAGHETAIIRFEGDLPGALKSRYQLRVEVGCVADETNVTNNVRVYDVAVNEP